MRKAFAIWLMAGLPVLADSVAATRSWVSNRVAEARAEWRGEVVAATNPVPSWISAAEGRAAAELAVATNGLPERIASVTNGLPEMIAGSTNGLPEQIASVTNGLPERIASVTNGLPEMVAGSTNGLPERVASVTNGLPEMVAGSTNGLPERIASAVDGLSGRIAAATNGVMGEVAAATGSLWRAVADIEGVTADIGALARTNDIPTRTSQLVNDTNFLTNHQDLTGLALAVGIFPDWASKSGWAAGEFCTWKGKVYRFTGAGDAAAQPDYSGVSWAETGVWDAIARAVSSGTNGVYLAVAGLVGGTTNGLPERIASVTNGLPERIASVTNGLPERIASVTNGLPEMVAGSTNGLPEMVASVTNGLPEAIVASTNPVPSWIAAATGDVPAQVSALVQSMVSGLDGKAATRLVSADGLQWIDGTGAVWRVDRVVAWNGETAGFTGMTQQPGWPRYNWEAGNWYCGYDAFTSVTGRWFLVRYLDGAKRLMVDYYGHGLPGGDGQYMLQATGVSLDGTPVEPGQVTENGWYQISDGTNYYHVSPLVETVTVMRGTNAVDRLARMESVVLAPVYSDTPTYGWVCVPAAFDGFSIEIVADSSSADAYAPYANGQPIGASLTLASGGDTITWRAEADWFGGSDLIATRVRTDLFGYTLGDQTDIVLVSTNSMSHGGGGVTTNDVCNIVTNETHMLASRDWKTTPALPEGYMVSWNVEYMGGGWVIRNVITEMATGAGGDAHNFDSVFVEFDIGSVHYEARREIVSVNVLGLARLSDIPTNNVQLANGAGYAVTNDVVLSPVYSDTPAYGSDWTYEGLYEGHTVIKSPEFYEAYGPHPAHWEMEVFDGTQGYVTYDYDSGADASTLHFGSDGTITATRVRTDIIGYTLGPQSNKVLAATAQIPAMPVISTNISADAASDVKTASPRAVKTYVDEQIAACAKPYPFATPAFAQTGWKIPSSWLPVTYTDNGVTVTHNDMSGLVLDTEAAAPSVVLRDSVGTAIALFGSDGAYESTEGTSQHTIASLAFDGTAASSTDVLDRPYTATLAPFTNMQIDMEKWTFAGNDPQSGRHWEVKYVAEGAQWNLFAIPDGHTLDDYTSEQHADFYSDSLGQSSGAEDRLVFPGGVTAVRPPSAFEIAVAPSTTPNVMRDLILVVKTGAIAPTVTFDGAIFFPRTSAEDDLTVEAGTNVYCITEYTTGKFIVSRWLGPSQSTGGGE